jgi:hypothetical protein
LDGRGFSRTTRAGGIGPGNEVMVPSAATLAHIAFACPGPVPGAPAKLKDGWSYFKQSLETIGCSPVGRRQTLATAVAASSRQAPCRLSATDRGDPRRRRRGYQRRERRRAEFPSMPAGDDRDQQQQTQVRLERHNTEQNASQDRAARKLQQSPCQEGGLAMRWSKHGRKGQADPERQRPPPQCRQIPSEPIAN